MPSLAGQKDLVLFLIIILLSFMVFLLPLSGPFRDTSLGHYGGSLFITG